MSMKGFQGKDRWVLNDHSACMGHIQGLGLKLICLQEHCTALWAVQHSAPYDSKQLVTVLREKG